MTATCVSACPKGVMGCGLSHILLAQKLWDQGTDVALVLEDDVYPSVDNLQEEMEKVMREVPEDWGIIKLHCDMCLDGTQPKGANGSFAAYIVNRKGMNYLKNLQLDWHIDLQVSGDPMVYKSHTNLFWADENGSSNRDTQSTLVGSFLELFRPKLSGEKTVDHVFAYKVIRIPGTSFEVTGWHLFYVLVLLGIVMWFWKTK
jgi:hypothetical protein